VIDIKADHPDEKLLRKYHEMSGLPLKRFFNTSGMLYRELELAKKLPDMPDCVFVVCKPEFSVSTPELFRKLDETSIGRRPDNRAMESALLAGDLGKVCENLMNVFDPVVTAEHLELNYIKSIFNNYGAVGYQMTGSGSAVFAVVTEFEYAAVICSMLKENYPQIYIAKPV